ncbi:MAG TPA: alpha/beta hydrolase [Frankiaceae bacterium]|nr:alpha/beta hydrolase [Frankiaceae bacterium]
MSDAAADESDFPSDIPGPIGLTLDEFVPQSIDTSSFTPTPPGTPHPQRHWWGRHVSEFRWTAELATLTFDPVFYGLGVPHGNGQPVMLVPGFLAADASLSVLGGWLFRLGYKPRRSGIILANVDCSDRAVDRLEKRLEKIVAANGRRAAIIGHSRGGHFAKALAARRPDLVSTVVSMGAGLDTPFDISVPTKAMVGGVRAVLHRASSKAREKGCLTSTCDCPFTRDYSAPFPTDRVSLTSIYSWGDGVVWPPACIVDYATNVRVPGSHVGLAFNRHAYRVIARTLAPKSES